MRDESLLRLLMAREKLILGACFLKGRRELNFLEDIESCFLKEVQFLKKKKKEKKSVPFPLSHTAERYTLATCCKSGPARARGKGRGGGQTMRVAASQLVPMLIVAPVVSRFTDSISIIMIIIICLLFKLIFSCWALAR